MLRLFALVCLLPVMAQAAVKNQNPVENLLYGNALYHYYLDDSLTALTLLAVNDAKSPDQAPALAALLLETLLKLDYGMALSAKVLIEKPDVSAALKQQDALWLHLANAFYQKQWFNLSLEALNRIEKPQRLSDYATWLYLQAQLALKNQQGNDALQYVKKLDKQSVYYAYVQYNLALHDYKNDHTSNALKRLDQLVAALKKAPTTEHTQLQQRALISAAYISLLSDQATLAEKYFGQLDSGSIFADEAIYGFGQTMLEREQYAASQQLWEKLSAYPYAHTLHIRAQLSLGQLHEQTDDLAKALLHFEQAERLSERYLARLNQLATRFTAEQLADLMMNADKSEERTALLREFITLTDLLSSSDFTSQLNNLADLQQIEQQLQLWQQQLLVMHDVSESRIRVFQQKAIVASEQKSQFAADDKKAFATQWQQEIQRIEQTNDVFALNNEEENELLQLIQRSENLLPQLEDDPFLEEYQDSLRKVKGALLWQAYQNYHGRLWQVKSALQGLERALTENATLSRSIDFQLSREQHFTDLQNNVAQQGQLISQQQDALAALYQEALEQLQKSFQQHLTQEQQQSLQQLKQARLAIARISEHFLDEHLP